MENEVKEVVKDKEMPPHGDLPTEFWFTKGYVGTPEEIEVAIKMGYPADEVERLKKEDGHMTVEEFYRIVPTHRLLEEMENRYKVHFEPVELTRVGDTFMLEMKAVDGPAAGKHFVCSVRGQDDRASVYSDNYFGVARADEYEAFVSNQVQEVLANCGIDAPCAVEATFDQMVEQHIPLFDPFIGGAFDYDGACAIALLAPPEETQFKAERLLDEIEDKFKRIGTGLSIELDVYPKELPAASSNSAPKLLLAAKNAITGNKPVTYSRTLPVNPEVRNGGPVPYDPTHALRSGNAA
ncbi:MAG: hypothetical protein IJ111_14860 [Eggerthellaceae bacterium]|nr:hypothetical protein [Eggerthellaceae bacterium]